MRIAANRHRTDKSVCPTKRPAARFPRCWRPTWSGWHNGRGHWMTSNPKYSGLLTDLYELTMAAGYLETGFDARATFELFVRSLPPRRNYLVASGLDQALDFLENVRFSDEEIAYLREQPVFARIGGDFFEYLAQFRFSGEVWAMPEGTVLFP